MFAWLAPAFAALALTLDFPAPDLTADLAGPQAPSSADESPLAFLVSDLPDPSMSLLQQLDGLSVLRSEGFGTSSAVASATIALAGDFRLRIGERMERPDIAAAPILSNIDQLQLAQDTRLESSRTSVLEADWDFSSWGGVTLFASQTQQPESALGAPMKLLVPGSKYANMLGVSAHLNFGDGWVTTFTYDEARTQFDLAPNSFAVQDGRGFDVELSKKNLIDEDALNIAVIRPPASASALQMALGGNDARLLGSQISLSSATPETDFELGYETSFDGNITLEANAAYQMNVAGQNGTRGVAVLSRAKINF